jgi:hypothetical protein
VCVAVLQVRSFVYGGQTGAEGDGSLGGSGFLLGTLLDEFLQPGIGLVWFGQQGRGRLGGVGKIRLESIAVPDCHQRFISTP